MTSEEKIFSVIILHYQQPLLWREAVGSVLEQNYPKIQLIFSDDGTENFSGEEVRKFVEIHQKGNIVDFQVLEHKENIGTVRNLNYAIKHVVGEYLKLFAADDVLCNREVLTTFAREFETELASAIYGRSIKCDRQLVPTGDEYITIEEAMQFNTMGWRKQFAQLSKKCCFPMGAMAFRVSKLVQYFPINEDYRLIEDWPLMLIMNRNHERFVFKNFPVIYYRAGGVSDPMHENRTHRVQCDCDHLLFHDREIWPYVRRLPWKDLKEFYERYKNDRVLMVEASKKVPFLDYKEMVKADIRMVNFLFNDLAEGHHRITVIANALLMGEVLFLILVLFSYFRGVTLLIWPVAIFVFNGLYQFYNEWRLFSSRRITVISLIILIGFIVLNFPLNRSFIFLIIVIFCINGIIQFYDEMQDVLANDIYNKKKRGEGDD